MSKFDLIKLHKNEINNGSTIVVLWQVSDILNKADDLEIHIDTYSACEILTRLEDDHECDNGITWQTIENAIIDYE